MHKEGRLRYINCTVIEERCCQVIGKFFRECFVLEQGSRDAFVPTVCLVMTVTMAVRKWAGAVSTMSENGSSVASVSHDGSGDHRLSDSSNSGSDDGRSSSGGGRGSGLIGLDSSTESKPIGDIFHLSLSPIDVVQAVGAYNNSLGSSFGAERSSGGMLLFVAKLVVSKSLVNGEDSQINIVNRSVPRGSECAPSSFSAFA